MFDRESTPSTDPYKGARNVFSQEEREGTGFLNDRSSFISAADRWGNVVYAASTLSSPLGTGVVISPLGFLLNSGAESFSHEAGQPNSVAPGKRPRSHISPSLVSSEGKPYLLIGASNGDGEIQTLAQTLVNIVDYGMDIEQAVNAPMWRFYPSPPPTSDSLTPSPAIISLDGRISSSAVERLDQMGWKTKREKEFPNNPDFILLMDIGQGRKKVVVPDGKGATIIAY